MTRRHVLHMLRYMYGLVRNGGLMIVQHDTDGEQQRILVVDLPAQQICECQGCASPPASVDLASNASETL